MDHVTRGFRGRRREPDESGRVPPGQYVTGDFPVLSAGPTPRTPLEEWSFAVVSETGEELARWSWEEFRALPAESVTVDIHCVTKWSKTTVSNMPAKPCSANPADRSSGV